jgi:hypothetical protein
MAMNSEQTRILKCCILLYFKVISNHSHGDNEETTNVLDV